MTDTDTMTQEYPVYEHDLFAEDALLNPFPHYAALRELGPVVRLREPDVLALSRFQDVTNALQSPDILISGEGTGFNRFINQKVPEPGVLNSDGERHRRMRLPLMKHLSPVALKPMRERLRTLIDEQIDTLVGAPTFDAITNIAYHLPVEVVSELVGLPAEDRMKMIRWATASFNVLGVIEKDGEMIPELKEDLESAMEVIGYLRDLDPDTLRPGSWSAELFQQVREKGMSLADARVSLRAFVLPSLDTTINAMGNLLDNLARHPDQYELLRNDPSLIPSAVFEGMRHTSILRWFSRFAAADYVSGDVFIPKGERVMILFGAANRDARKYPDPDLFDVTRNPADQLSWSAGPHLCAGKHLARMEMEVMLEALVNKVARIEADEPVRLRNRGVYGIKELPMRLFAA
ncbi:MAG: cytochrome P450 [Sphingobium sp.]|uniref:cytochrome P450 n=1 Tax=Sphingobium sp. TaxID=1912891 RepID=UPI0029BD340D|nr:cytochrome P450 [Sphingobium sp.]MDX3911568.1 cytochrome P450 [Sphingobium sp.]